MTEKPLQQQEFHKFIDLKKAFDRALQERVWTVKCNEKIYFKPSLSYYKLEDFFQAAWGVCQRRQFSHTLLNILENIIQ